MSTKPTYLIHYASEYYDPVAAHEYYMKHRQLKGRRHGTLNEEGQFVLLIVNSIIMAFSECIGV